MKNMLFSLVVIVTCCMPFIKTVGQEHANPSISQGLEDRLWMPVAFKFEQNQWISSWMTNTESHPVRIRIEGGDNVMSLTPMFAMEYDTPDPLFGYGGKNFGDTGVDGPSNIILPGSHDAIFSSGSRINSLWGIGYKMPEERPSFELLQGEGFGGFHRLWPRWHNEHARGETYITAGITCLFEESYLVEDATIEPGELLEWQDDFNEAMTFNLERLAVDNRHYPVADRSPQDWDMYLPRMDDPENYHGRYAWIGPKPLDTEQSFGLWVMPNPEHQAGEDLELTYAVHNIYDYPVWIWQNDCVPAHVDWTLRSAKNMDALASVEDLEKENVITEIEQPNADILISLLPKREAVYLMPGECLTYQVTLTDEQLGELRARRNYRLQATLSFSFLPSREEERDARRYGSPVLGERPNLEDINVQDNLQEVTVTGAWLVRPE